MVIENSVIAKTNRVQWARQHDALVIFVRVGFSQDYVECPTTSPLFSYVQQAKALQLNTWGTALDSHLDV